MKKINNKGFLLVETLVVATFLLTVLVLLYLQFRNLIISYNASYKYNTVEGIYNLEPIKNYIDDNLTNEELKQLLGDNDYYTLYDASTDSNISYDCNLESGELTACSTLVKVGKFDKLIYTKSNLDKLKTDLKNDNFMQNNTVFTEDLKDFIIKLENKESRHRLIAKYKDGTFATIVFGFDSNNK